MRLTLISFNLNIRAWQITRARRTNQSKSRQASLPIWDSVFHTLTLFGLSMEQNNQRQKKKKENRKEKTKINEQKLYIKLLSSIYAKNGLSLSQVELGEKLYPLADPKSKLKIFL